MYQLTEKYLMTDILVSFTDNAESFSKYAWKRRVCKAIAKREHNLWEYRTNTDVDLTLFRQLHNYISPGDVWSFSK